MPFVFANFNGTRADVRVFTHEVGHAVQSYRSRALPLLDLLGPTHDGAEIHSMSLEFLTWPHMERFFGEDAARFHRMHLQEAILLLPYGTAVDHFQHELYARPDLTPYLPWCDWGDLIHPAKGGRWQHQRHIYVSPFYYIDYVLAEMSALQLWCAPSATPTGRCATTSPSASVVRAAVPRARPLGGPHEPLRRRLPGRGHRRGAPRSDHWTGDLSRASPFAPCPPACSPAGRAGRRGPRVRRVARAALPDPS
jgi:Peptidase family M3